VDDYDQSIMPADRLLLLGKSCRTGSANVPAAWQFGRDDNDDKQRSYNYMMSKEEIKSCSEY
jgi:hypothetical protein